MGPHTFNFALAAELSLAAGAAERLPDIDAAVRRAAALAHDAATKAVMVAAARHFAAQHCGAAERMAQAVLALVPGC
jgi:3-deoxy-D-manno-octulosonic-acid transferase